MIKITGNKKIQILGEDNDEKKVIEKSSSRIKLTCSSSGIFDMNDTCR